MEAGKWVYKYEENTIEVANSAFSSSLYVNGEMKDKIDGLTFRAKLSCELNCGAKVKASLRGFFKVNCLLSIDDKMQTPEAKL